MLKARRLGLAIGPVVGCSAGKKTDEPLVPPRTNQHMPSGIERRREIRRRRTRRKKTANLIARVKAGTMEKVEAIRKLRRLTTGAEVVIDREGWK